MLHSEKLQFVKLALSLEDIPQSEELGDSTSALAMLTGAGGGAGVGTLLNELSGDTRRARKDLYPLMVEIAKARKDSKLKGINLNPISWVHPGRWADDFKKEKAKKVLKNLIPEEKALRSIINAGRIRKGGLLGLLGSGLGLGAVNQDAIREALSGAAAEEQ
jgi:hypothetical protein